MPRGKRRVPYDDGEDLSLIHICTKHRRRDFGVRVASQLFQGFQHRAAEKIEAGKAYSLKEAASLVKEITFTKFDASLDIDVRLGVDPRKANQMVRGVVSLPHGTGKEVRVLVLCTPDAEAAAKEAGADYVCLSS